MAAIAAILAFPALNQTNPTLIATTLTTLTFTYVENKSEIKFLDLPPVVPNVPYLYTSESITFTWTAPQGQQATLLWNRDKGKYTDPAANAGATTMSSQASVASQSSQSSSPLTTSASNQSPNATPTSGLIGSAFTAKPTSLPTSSGVPHPAGVSSGAAAGIGIGCAFVGALIAALLLWFCGRKRRAAHATGYEPSRSTLIAQEKGFATTQALPVESQNSTRSPLAGSLPLPIEDKLIVSEISKISNLIKNHTQSYYHNNRVNPTLVDHDDLRPLGKNLPISTEELSAVLMKPATREIGLRFCLAWVVIRGMEWNKDLENSFLPAEVSRSLQAVESTGTNARSTTSLRSQWRVMTAHLMQPSYTQSAFGPSDSRNSRIQAAANTLDGILQPFADPRMDNEQRKRNMEEILKRSASFALTLFSQPSTWDFDWHEQQFVKSSDLCIFPALLQLTDENGEPISPPRTFSDATLRRLDT